jgi:hypothetical protein
MKTPEQMAEEYCNTKQLSYVERLVITKGFVDGYQAAAPQWISVKDRLPEKDQEVLMYDGIFILTCLFWKSRKLAFQWELSSGIICNPTHWMPLPKPPEDSKT